MNFTVKARAGHSLTALSVGPGLTEVLQFGGSPKGSMGSYETQPKMAETTILHFSKDGLQ